MKYKVKIVATATVWVDKDEWFEEGGIGEFNEFAAVMFAKGELCERLRNNPSYGSVKIEKYEIPNNH